VLTIFVPASLGLAIPGPPAFLGPTLAHLRHVGFRLFVNQFSAVLYALVFLFMLVLLRVIVRRTWLAMALWCLLVGGPLLTEDVLLGWSAGLLRAVLFLLVLSRGGLLALATTLFVLFVTVEVPLTLDFSAWYGTRALPVVLAVLGLAVYGFFTSLAGKPVFGRLLADD
jgi:hypothetical protein